MSVASGLGHMGVDTVEKPSVFVAQRSFPKRDESGLLLYQTLCSNNHSLRSIASLGASGYSADAHKIVGRTSYFRSRCWSWRAQLDATYVMLPTS